MIPILITTKYKGVFYAEVDDSADLTSGNLTDLKNVKCAIYWGTTKGVFELAHTGPTDSSTIGAPADWAYMGGVTAIALVTPEAKLAWDAR